MCIGCPITHVDLLSIDHIEGNGRAHNKEIGTSGGNGLYQWLKKNDFPEGFQVLCGACNMAKRQIKLAQEQERDTKIENYRAIR